MNEYNEIEMGCVTYLKITYSREIKHCVRESFINPLVSNLSLRVVVILNLFLVQEKHRGYKGIRSLNG